MEKIFKKKKKKYVYIEHKFCVWCTYNISVKYVILRKTKSESGENRKIEVAGATL
jgi:hypothetical protein